MRCFRSPPAVGGQVSERESRWLSIFIVVRLALRMRTAEVKAGRRRELLDAVHRVADDVASGVRALRDAHLAVSAVGAAPAAAIVRGDSTWKIYIRCVP